MAMTKTHPVPHQLITNSEEEEEEEEEEDDDDDDDEDLTFWFSTFAMLCSCCNTS